MSKGFPGIFSDFGEPVPKGYAAAEGELEAMQLEAFESLSHLLSLSWVIWLVFKEGMLARSSLLWGVQSGASSSSLPESERLGDGGDSSAPGKAKEASTEPEGFGRILGMLQDPVIVESLRHTANLLHRVIEKRFDIFSGVLKSSFTSFSPAQSARDKEDGALCVATISPPKCR